MNIDEIKNFNKIKERILSNLFSDNTKGLKFKVERDFIERVESSGILDDVKELGFIIYGKDNEYRTIYDIPLHDIKDIFPKDIDSKKSILLKNIKITLSKILDEYDKDIDKNITFNDIKDVIERVNIAKAKAVIVNYDNNLIEKLQNNSNLSEEDEIKLNKILSEINDESIKESIEKMKDKKNNNLFSSLDVFLSTNHKELIENINNSSIFKPLDYRTMNIKRFCLDIIERLDKKSLSLSSIKSIMESNFSIDYLDRDNNIHTFNLKGLDKAINSTLYSTLNPDSIKNDKFLQETTLKNIANFNEILLDNLDNKEDRDILNDIIENLGSDISYKDGTIIKMIKMSKEAKSILKGGINIDTSFDLIENFNNSLNFSSNVIKNIYWDIKNELTSGVNRVRGDRPLFNIQKSASDLSNLGVSRELISGLISDYTDMVAYDSDIKKISSIVTKDYIKAGKEEVTYSSNNEIDEFNNFKKISELVKSEEFKSMINNIDKVNLNSAILEGELEKIKEMAAYLKEINRPDVKEGDIGINTPNKLISIYNELSSDYDLPKISTLDTGNKPKTSMNWNDKKSDLKIIEEFFILKLSEYSLVEKEIDNKYNILSREIDKNMLILPIEYRNLSYFKNNPKYADPNVKVSFDTIQKAIDYETELLSEVNTDVNTMLEIEKLNTKKRNLLSRTIFEDARKDVIEDTKQFLEKNIEKIRGNLKKGSDIYEGVENIDELFFDKDEIENLVKDMEYENYIDSNKYHIESLFKQFEKYKESDDDTSSVKGSYLSYIPKNEDSTIQAIVENRLETIGDIEDKEAVVERLVNEVKKEREELIEYNRQLERYKKIMQQEFSNEVKESFEEIKKDYQIKELKKFNSNLVGLLYQYPNIDRELLSDLINDFENDTISPEKMNEVIQIDPLNFGNEEDKNRFIIQAVKMGIYQPIIDQDGNEQVGITFKNKMNQFENEALLIEMADNSFGLNPLREEFLSKSKGLMLENSSNLKVAATYAFDKAFDNYEKDSLNPDGQNLEFNRMRNFFNSRDKTGNYENIYTSYINAENDLLNQINPDNYIERYNNLKSLQNTLNSQRADAGVANNNALRKELNELYPIADFDSMDLEDISGFLKDISNNANIRAGLNYIKDINKRSVLTDMIAHADIDEGLFKADNLNELERLNNNYFRKAGHALADFFDEESNIYSRLRKQVAKKNRILIDNYLANTYDVKKDMLYNARDMLNPVKVFKTYVQLFALAILMTKLTGSSAMELGYKVSRTTSLTGINLAKAFYHMYDKDDNNIVGKPFNKDRINLKSVTSKDEQYINKFKEIMDIYKTIDKESLSESLTGPDMNKDREIIRNMIKDVFPKISKKNDLEHNNLKVTDFYNPNHIRKEIDKHLNILKERFNNYSTMPDNNPATEYKKNAGMLYLTKCISVLELYKHDILNYKGVLDSSNLSALELKNYDYIKRDFSDVMAKVIFNHNRDNEILLSDELDKDHRFNLKDINLESYVLYDMVFKNRDIKNLDVDIISYINNELNENKLYDNKHPDILVKYKSSANELDKNYLINSLNSLYNDIDKSYVSMAVKYSNELQKAEMNNKLEGGSNNILSDNNDLIKNRNNIIKRNSDRDKEAVINFTNKVVKSIATTTGKSVLEVIDGILDGQGGSNLTLYQNIRKKEIEKLEKERKNKTSKIRDWDI